MNNADYDNSYSRDSLYIYLTGGFMNDSLAIEYSSERIIETDVTTDEVLGYAKEIVLPYKGTDTVRVILERPDWSNCCIHSSSCTPCSYFDTITATGTFSTA